MTTTDELKTRAQTLKLYGLLAHWDEISDQDWVVLLIEWEEAERQARSLQRRLSNARLGQFKPLADFDWQWPKRCDRAALEELMRLGFLGEAGNAVLVGPNGQGVINGHTVLFTTASGMLNELAAQDGDSALRRRLKRYTHPELLVIDEIGYLSYGNRHADLLFEIVSRRYEEKSTVVTTNRPFAEWGEVFPNASCVVSLIDRLVHNAEIINIEGDSYRLKEARERSQQRQQKRAKRKPRAKSATRKEE